MTRKVANPARPWSRAKEMRRSLTRDALWAAEWIEKLIGACHPKQQDFALDDARRISALCSRGAGKSTGALVRILLTMAQRRKAPCVFIATTKEQARDIAWEHLKDICEKAGIEADFVETRLVCTLANGSTLKLAGADDRKEIDKLRGRAFAGVVIDEAASHPAHILEALIDRVIGPRLGEHDGWIALIGTPGHELRGEFFEATRPNGPEHRPFRDRELPENAGWLGWSSHHWTLEDGAPYVAALAKLWADALLTKKRKGWSDTNPVWLREYKAQWAADDTDNVFRYRPYDDDGKPFNQWDPPREDKSGYRFAILPERDGKPVDDWQHVYSLDKGFADAFAVNVLSFSPSDPQREIRHTWGHERTEVYARLIAVLFLGPELSTDKPTGLFAVTGWPAAIVGDVDEAFLSELANVYGIRAKKAIKKADYKAGAIEETNGGFRDQKIFILRGSPLDTQLLTLQWVVDEYGRMIENKAQPNHSTDTLIYGRKEIAHLFDSGVVDDKPRRRARPAAQEESESPPPDDDFRDLLSSGAYDEEPWP